MIALKNDPIWERLGDPKTFDDALGNPYPPFAFNSGYDVRDVSRKEAERLGVIAPNAPALQPQTRDLLSDIHASAANFDKALQSALENDPELVMQDGVLALPEGVEKPRMDTDEHGSRWPRKNAQNTERFSLRSLRSLAF